MAEVTSDTTILRCDDMPFIQSCVVSFGGICRGLVSDICLEHFFILLNFPYLTQVAIFCCMADTILSNSTRTSHTIEYYLTRSYDSRRK